MNKIYGSGAFAALVLLGGCATTQSVTQGPQVGAVALTKACLIEHGGRSTDMDTRIQQGLEVHGVSVLMPPDCDKNTSGIDFTVSYVDHWRWDLVMYLRELDIRFYTAPDSRLIALGHWENSPMHQFPITDHVVADLMDDMFNHVQGKAPGTTATTQQ